MENPNLKKDTQEFEADDYVVSGAVSDNAILNNVKSIKETVDDDVVYGVYNNVGRGIVTRINDFFIDHSKISLKEKSYFFHMLAVMIDAGIPVVSALKSLARRTNNGHFRRIINTVFYDCEHGSTLSDAMSRFEEIFDEGQIGIVKSGEATGKLNTMLFKLSSQLDKKSDLNSKLFGAAIYPIVVLIVLLIVTSAMLIWIFPTLLSILSEGGVVKEKLPLPTRALIFVQGAFVNYWWALLIFIFGIYGILNIYLSTDYGSIRWDYRKLKLPIVGVLLRKVYVLRFVSLLGLLIDAGIPVIRALKIAGSSVANKVYKIKVQEVIDAVRNGSKISDNLSDSEFLFSSDVVQMLRVGEVSASLGKVSEKISEHYEKEIDNSLKSLSAVFEPAMILFVGLLVGILALSIMAPIFNMSTAVSS